MPIWSEILAELGQRSPPDFDGVRRKYLLGLHRHSKRAVTLYASGWLQKIDSPALTSIGDEDMQALMKVCQGLGNGRLDLILHSPGGSPEAAEVIISYLRSRFSHIRVIVPQLAMSAATMISCAADGIVLGRHSFLGPIDPQIILQTSLGMSAVPAQAVSDQFDRAQRERTDPRKLSARLPMPEQYGPDLLTQCEVDGTKVRTNAGKCKVTGYGRMLRREQGLEAEIKALPDRAHATDMNDDGRFGESFRSNELPEKLRRREDRLVAIEAAKRYLEATQREVDDVRGRRSEWKRNPKGGRPYKRAYGEPDGKAQGNFIDDPENATTRISSEGFQRCCNAQVAVNGEYQLIVATELTSNASDQGALVSLPDEVRDGFDTQPGTVPADAGYCNGRNLSELKTRSIDGYVRRSVS